MKSTCEYCSNTFEHENAVKFCPFCGKPVTSDSPKSELSPSAMMDSIWGYTGQHRKRLISDIDDYIFDCLNLYKESINAIIPQLTSADYSKRFALLKNSANRKALFDRIASFLELSKNEIDANRENEIHSFVLQSKQISANYISKLMGIESALELSTSLADLNDVLNDIEMAYSLEPLTQLYNEVKVSFEKFKRCVNDNDMFAAFSGGTEYTQWSSRVNHSHFDIDDYESSESSPQLEIVPLDSLIADLKERNNLSYSGFIDEDFVPHVEAFWYGLFHLSHYVGNLYKIDLAGTQLLISKTDMIRDLAKKTVDAYTKEDIERLEVVLCHLKSNPQQ